MLGGYHWWTYIKVKGQHLVMGGYSETPKLNAKCFGSRLPGQVQCMWLIAGGWGKFFIQYTWHVCVHVCVSDATQCKV